MSTDPIDDDDREYRAWQSRYARIVHLGCPGIQYEDACPYAADACAEVGCKILAQKRAAGERGEA